MKLTIQKFLEYLRSVRNASPHTMINYGKDLEQFVTFLTPPGMRHPADDQDQSPHDSRIYRTSARRRDGKKLDCQEAGGAAIVFQVLRARRMLKDNPARLVPTPKLPKRIPIVLSAEEMSGFLDQLAGMQDPGTKRRGKNKGQTLRIVAPNA